MSARPPWPTRVKIGWKRFTVLEWHPETARAAHKYGECDHIEATIRVDTSHGPLQAVETLWHECLHAAVDVGGAHASPRDDDMYDEEHIVSYLGSWSITILNDNPQLLAYMAWAAAQED